MQVLVLNTAKTCTIYDALAKSPPTGTNIVRVTEDVAKSTQQKYLPLQETTLVNPEQLLSFERLNA